MGYEVGVNILLVVSPCFVSPHMLTASARSPGLQDPGGPQNRKLCEKTGQLDTTIPPSILEDRNPPG